MGEPREWTEKAEGVRLGVDDGVAYVCLDRPPRNFLIPATMAGLAATLRESDADESVRAVVLTGSGETFCAGLDIERIRAGDEHAFADLVRRDAGRLLAVTRRILNNEDDAREAVHEAFIAVYRARDQFQAASRLSTWLHRIAINTALMKLRARKRRPEEAIDDLLPRFLVGLHRLSSLALRFPFFARLPSRSSRAAGDRPRMRPDTAGP